MSAVNKYRHEHAHGGFERQKHGVSSYELQDSKLVFRELKLSKGHSFLDLGVAQVIMQYSF